MIYIKFERLHQKNRGKKNHSGIGTIRTETQIKQRTKTGTIQTSTYAH